MMLLCASASNGSVCAATQVSESSPGLSCGLQGPGVRGLDSESGLVWTLFTQSLEAPGPGLDSESGLLLGVVY